MGLFCALPLWIFVYLCIKVCPALGTMTKVKQAAEFVLFPPPCCVGMLHTVNSTSPLPLHLLMRGRVWLAESSSLARQGQNSLGRVEKFVLWTSPWILSSCLASACCVVMCVCMCVCDPLQCPDPPPSVLLTPLQLTLFPFSLLCLFLCSTSHIFLENVFFSI